MWQAARACSPPKCVQTTAQMSALSKTVDVRVYCESTAAYLALGAARNPADERLGGRTVEVDPIRGGTLSHLAIDEVANIELGYIQYIKEGEGVRGRETKKRA